MKHLKNLTLTLALAISSVAVAADVAGPDILVPTTTGAEIIEVLSNNGKYGVASARPGSDGFSYTVGAIFYDLTGTSPKPTVLTGKHNASGARDVTDDGKIVAGSVDHRPAICRNNNGNWEWETLPVPNKSVTLDMEDMYTGQISKQTFRLNGGQVNAITPDGKYAVGLCRSNEYELFEYATMWDLTTMQIIDVPFPETDLFGENDHQSRFMQVSDDGRYLLCWNSFSYSGNIVFVFDRQTNKPIYIDLRPVAGTFVYRDNNFKGGLEIDGLSKAMSPNGRYVAAGIYNNKDQCYPFIFDVWEEKLTIFDDGIHEDVTAWSVNNDGLVLGATPAVTPYADAMIITPDYFYPFESLFAAYGTNLGAYGIDNTGKPVMVSDDGKTVTFITSTSQSYVARFKEPIQEGIDRINLMSSWSVSPASGTKMSSLSTVTFTFENPVEFDSSRVGDVKVTDSKGNAVATAKADGITLNNTKMTFNFGKVDMAEGETYTLTIPEGFCWIKNHSNSINNTIQVKYQGRANVPVEVKSVSPSSGLSISSLDLNDNPVIVTFDAPVKINGTADNRPIAHLYIDGAEESAASLSLDVDLTTNRLVIYPNTTIYLYKGSDYTIKVPEGAVVDLSGAGPSKAFEISYHGSYVPQLGDEVYVFKSSCDNFDNFLFYDGDKRTPTSEYEAMSFTATTTPWWVVMDDETSTDMAFASHSCYTDGGASDDWVMIRQLNLPSDVDCYLSFQGQSYRKAKEDYLKIYVYTDDQAYNQLTSTLAATIREKGDLVFNEKLDPGATEAKMAGEWTDYVINLAKYKGKNIYIAFVNDNKNQSMVMIDNIAVVKEVLGFITITSPVNVVDLDSAPVAGIVTVQSELADYDSISLTLLDNEGNKISSVSDNVSLTGGDTYRFTFPQELPVVRGEENPYTIEYTLGEDQLTYEGVIRDLAFNVEKHVVIEEQTGKDCQFCPLGIAAMERLESLYGSQVIPVALHVYNNSDPKGMNVIDYASTVFAGNGSAPTGRINRRPNITAPMISDDAGKYHMTSSEVPGGGLTWQDELVAELAEPSYLDVVVTPQVSSKAGQVSYKVTIKSALNLEDMSIRLLGVLLEDNLLDSQKSGVFNSNDPLLGEFGNGGIYGKGTFYYTFNNVARGFWGQSANGTPRLFPSTLEVGKEYSTEFAYNIPGIVNDPANIKMVVMLIDESTGRVINAAVQSADVTGVDEIVSEEAAAITIGKVGNEIVVKGVNDIEVEVYSLDGRKLRSTAGNGTVYVDVEGYKGVVVVRAAANGSVATAKLIL